MWLIAGLGNPGLQYRQTRHNIGFMVVDELASRGLMTHRGRKRGARYLSGWIDQQEVTLIKPLTFMNRSGISVRAWLTALLLEPSRLIVIHDDLDLPPFRIRIRRGGTSGGHRGIASIVEELGSADFLRIKIGIGRPGAGDDASDYVLAPFGPEEREGLPDAIKKGADAVVAVITYGPQTAMNIFNARSRMEKQTCQPDRACLK